MTDASAAKARAAARAMILPLALAQFIASYAATNMNVAISADQTAALDGSCGPGPVRAADRFQSRRS